MLGDRHGGVPRRRLVLQVRRRSDDFGTRQPDRRRASPRRRSRGSSQSGNFTRQFIYAGIQPGRGEPQAARRRRGRRSPAGRVAAQRALGPARRRARALPDGQRRAAVVGRLSRRRAQPAGAAASSTRCNLPPARVPKVDRAFRRARKCSRLKMTTELGRHERRLRHPADAQRPPLLHRRARRTAAAPGGFNHQPPRPPAPTARATTGARDVCAPTRCRRRRWSTSSAWRLRAWLMTGALPPPSRYPTLVGGTLVDPTRAGDGLSGRHSRRAGVDLRARELRLPGVRLRLGTCNSMRATRPALRPTCRRRSASVISMKVPRVDADGNELGGVPTVLRDAPLGTYLGWNITAAGFHRGQVCSYIGGYDSVRDDAGRASGERRSAPVAGRALRHARRLRRRGARRRRTTPSRRAICSPPIATR